MHKGKGSSFLRAGCAGWVFGFLLVLGCSFRFLLVLGCAFRLSLGLAVLSHLPVPSHLAALPHLAATKSRDGDSMDCWMERSGAQGSLGASASARAESRKIRRGTVRD